MQKKLALFLTLIFIFANFSQIMSEDTIRWRYHTADDVRAASLGDVNGDGKFDVVLGSGTMSMLLIVLGKRYGKRKLLIILIQCLLMTLMAMAEAMSLWGL